MSATKIKILEQNLARLTASMAWESDKDQVRRRIKITKDLLRQLRKESS